MTNSQVHNVSGAGSAENLSFRQLSALSARTRGQLRASDLRLYRLSATVRGAVRNIVQLSASPPLYSGDSGQDPVLDRVDPSRKTSKNLWKA